MTDRQEAMLVDQTERAIVATNARQFERELLAAKLEAELLQVDGLADASDLEWRKGWNARATSIVAGLRGAK